MCVAQIRLGGCSAKVVPKMSILVPQPNFFFIRFLHHYLEEIRTVKFAAIRTDKSGLVTSCRKFAKLLILCPLDTEITLTLSKQRGIQIADAAMHLMQSSNCGEWSRQSANFGFLSRRSSSFIPPTLTVPRPTDRARCLFFAYKRGKGEERWCWEPSKRARGAAIFKAYAKSAVP